MFIKFLDTYLVFFLITNSNSFKIFFLVPTDLIFHTFLRKTADYIWLLRSHFNFATPKITNKTLCFIFPSK